MPDRESTRRNAVFVLLILLCVGGILVMGWAFKAAFVAFGMLVRVFAGLGGLLLVGFLIFVVFRSVFGRK